MEQACEIVIVNFRNFTTRLMEEILTTLIVIYNRL